MPSDCFHTCKTTDNGNEVVEWMASVFGTCVYEGEFLGMLAFWIGMSSLGFWIMCQLPQFIENYQRKSASALSYWFILEWFSGDITNLVGAFLTNQQMTQKMTASLFCFMDCCMLSQMYYYNFYMKAPQRDAPGKVVQAFKSSVTNYEQVQQMQGDMRDAQGLSSPGGIKHTDKEAATSSASRVGVGCGTAVLGLVIITVCTSAGPEDPQLPALGPTRRLLDTGCAIELPETVQTIGTVLGWLSAFIYLNSRLPQVYKNWKSKSVEGLSALMFFCAVMGNVTYALGVLVKATGWPDIYDALPWLVGSLGTVVFDFIIVIQCFMYANKSDAELIAAHLINDVHSEDLTDGLLDQSASPTPQMSSPTPQNRKRKSSFIKSILDREGSRPVYLDSGTEVLSPSMAGSWVASSSAGLASSISSGGRSSIGRVV